MHIDSSTGDRWWLFASVPAERMNLEVATAAVRDMEGDQSCSKKPLVEDVYFLLTIARLGRFVL